MSWMKRPQGSAVPPPGPAREPCAAPVAQPIGNQQNMYQNYQTGAAVAGNVAPQQQQQYWQLPAQQPPQYTQQYGQVYQQQDYPANANQFYQQPNQFNQNYTNQSYNNAQQSYPQNYYQNQGAQQNYSQKPPQDGWDENWDWGWEDSSKQAQRAPPTEVQATPAHQLQPPQQQVFNNANIIEESFATSDCWNWAMDEKKGSQEPTAMPHSHDQPASNLVVENNSVPEQIAPRSSSNILTHHPEEVRTLNDREVVKERLPNLALGKRFHLDNLTPQWSIESQMSQESSDGPHTHSEGTYTSGNQSRNSSKSSPGLNTDNSNFNYSQPGLEEGYPQNSEWSRPLEEPTLTESTLSNSRRESHDELSSSMQEMSLINHEVPSTESTHQAHEVDYNSVQESISVAQPPPARSPANFPPPVSSSMPPALSAMPPPPPVTSVSTVPLPSVASTLPPPPSSSAAPPPNYPPPPSSQNPFKHVGPFSHKTLAKGASGSATSVQTFPPPLPSTNLTSPAVVSKVSQHRVPVGAFEANLETTPDNSERPDQPVSSFRPMPVSQQVPDNMEVAPRNDRNEYLQTAHLSSGDYGENTDFSRGVPPPGLRRMVVGQQESEYNQALNISGDEPPPGLARMVPGQQTEAENSYNQSGDNYLDRHIDGQPTDTGSRPYRQADGQQNPDNYTQQAPSRGSERRPIGLDRMVPGEPSNDEYPQYQTPTYAGSNEQRVVTGVDHEFSIPADAGPPDVREQNVDGSDYSEQNARNPPRNIIGARESSNDASPDFIPPPDEQQREITMEGENLQDLSIITSSELAFSREQIVDGADITLTDIGTDRKTDLSDSIEHQATSSRRQSINRVNTSEEDSERDRAFKSSPRRDRDKHKSTRDRDRDRDRDRERERDRDRDKDGRYSRGDRKYDPDRSDRRLTRDDKERRDRNGYRERRSRDDSPESRRHRRSTRSHRYEPEDDDYYSDRERERRRHREGSYTSSKPPRPDDERERAKRHGAPHDERRRRERFERSYRDIDPSRRHGNLRRQRDDERRGEFSSPSRPDSRDATVTDDDMNESRRRGDPHRRSRRTAEPFYNEYGGAGYDAYAAQRQQYQYYEQLRLSNPAAYMQLYKRIMAGHAPAPPAPHALYPDDFGGAAYEARREERGSVHSGRSSAGLKGADTYYGAYRLDAAASLRDAPSLRTDISDRDNLTTDMSLNLHLEESTVRSERMTPFRYSTAHIKGSIGSRDVVVVRPSYPVDGAPATVHVLSLRAALAACPSSAELSAFPGPLVKGVTHKKSVIDYCALRVRAAAGEGARDVTGYVLLWDLLALMLRQNGVVVGTDIAELLMKNTREYEYKPTTNKPHNESRRGSSVSEGREEDLRSSSPDQPSISVSDNMNAEPAPGAAERLRELLLYGNRQEAIEWAMSNNLWAHALALATYAERRVRAAVYTRWLAAQPRADPLHTLYAALAHAPAPAAACVADEHWADWRPHAAMLLSNPSSKADLDRRTLTQLGDSLSSRGLLYSAQFCYMSAGLSLGAHPLAPLPAPGAPPAASGAPRLSLLLADPRASTLHQLATNRALFATEVLEYARSLCQDDYVLPELQTYKLVLACRLVDCGLYERALAYTEAAARAVTRSPRDYSPALIAHLAALADRLKYHDPALQDATPDEADSADGSPRHQQWLRDVQGVALGLQAESAAPLSQQTTPQHNNYYGQQQQQQVQYNWEQQQAPQYQPPVQTYEQPIEETPDYATQYYQQQQQQQQPVAQPAAPPVQQEEPQYGYEEWPREEHSAQSYGDYSWNNDNSYGYGEAGVGAGAGAGAEEARPQITMPGASKPHAPGLDYDDDRPPSTDQQNERDTDTPKTAARKQENKSKDDGKEGKNKTGWLGGILTKLSLRPPNQMILPDDKNPTIVWDPDTKRWRNTDGAGEAGAGGEVPPPPPPRAMPSTSPPLQAGAVGGGAPPPVPNIFKMQKGRHIKKAYVDVFNPSGAPTRALPPAAEVLGPAQPLGAPTNYFIPAPAPQVECESSDYGFNDVQELSQSSVYSEAIEVAIPSSPSPTPPPSLSPFEEGGPYDPTNDSYERSGI